MPSSVVFKISRSDLSALDQPSEAVIADVKHISSYNWIESGQPTIAVPGCPPRWRNETLPRRVQKDSGLIYIAQNAARHPDSPMEPLFRSMFVEQPFFDVSSVDIVSDRNNFRKLLAFVQPEKAKHGREAFTIDTEAAGDTTIFCRAETAVSEFIGPGEFRGFGHEFEKAYTVNEMRGSAGHHRIINYRLGGLGMVIRYETDAFVGHGRLARPKFSASDEMSLATELASLAIANPSIAYPNQSELSKLSVRRQGHEVDVDSTLEIKTRARHRPLPFEEVAPQLWFSQTSKLVRAYHDKGVFQPPRVEEVSAQIKRYETENQNSLRLFVALVARLARETKTHRHLKIEYDPVADVLKGTKIEAKKMLPADLYLKWNVTSATDREQAQQPSRRDSMTEDTSPVVNIPASPNTDPTLHNQPTRPRPYIPLPRRVPAAQGPLPSTPSLNLSSRRPYRPRGKPNPNKKPEGPNGEGKTPAPSSSSGSWRKPRPQGTASPPFQ